MKFSYRGMVTVILCLCLLVSVLMAAGVFDKNEIIIGKAEETHEVSVYLVGEVAEPGIYKVARGSILSDVITLAGGLCEGADPQGINLVYRIDRNLMIRISASYSEIMPDDTGIGVYDASLADVMVDINKAGVEELCRIPGVGEATAKAIIAYREANGEFSVIEDIMKVTGIKHAKYETMKDFICVK